MRRLRSRVSVLAALCALAACRSTEPRPPQDSPPGLGGTAWQLVQFQGGDGTTLTPDDRTKYTIEFGTEGSLNARIDCNRGRGNWTSSGPGQLLLGLLVLTRAQCAPGSLHDRLVQHWPYVRSYLVKEGHLFLSLMADGGIYEFEPMRPQGSPGVRSDWRRGWDSNPRGGYPPTRFRGGPVATTSVPLPRGFYPRCRGGLAGRRCPLMVRDGAGV